MDVGTIYVYQQITVQPHFAQYLFKHILQVTNCASVLVSPGPLLVSSAKLVRGCLWFYPVLPRFIRYRYLQR